MMGCKNENNHCFPLVEQSIERYIKRSVAGKTGMVVEELRPMIRLRCSSCGLRSSLETDMFDNARWLTRLQDEMPSAEGHNYGSE